MRIHLGVLTLIALGPGCGPAAEPPAAPPAPEPVTPATPVARPGRSCTEERSPLVQEKRRLGTKGKLARPRGKAPDAPPPGMFERVQYPAEVGPLHAYVTPDPGDHRRHPVVVWAHGGFDWSIDDFFFKPGAPDNDQSAAAFREAGVVLMIPSFRGANDNPGMYEGLFGEVDDFLCAAAYAAALPYVDPEQVYLGGHSTGGTLVLLAAASSDRFREAFAFGPVADPRGYGDKGSPFADAADATEAEWRVRSPIHWLGDIRRPTTVIEGEGGNAADALALDEEAKRRGAPVTVMVGRGQTHFSVLRPASEVIAKGIAGPSSPAAGGSQAPQAAKLVPKIDPETMKTYRLDVCHTGGYALRQGRADYLAKVGSGAPGPGRVPVFEPIALPSGPVDVPFERNARACQAAAGLHDPALGEVDAALAGYAPLALDLAKDLTAARTYYRDKQHEADGFAEGRALHARLVAGFARLDAAHDRLGAALSAYRKARVTPLGAADEGERIARAAVMDAQAMVALAHAPRLDTRAFDAAAAKVEAAGKALSERAADPSDPWAKIIPKPLAAFHEAAAAVRLSRGPRPAGPALHRLVHELVSLIEARQRAISRATLAAAKGP